MKLYFKRKSYLGILLITFLVISSVLANFMGSTAQAAGVLSNYSLQINNSKAGASGVTYTFHWTTSATTAINQIDIQVCTAASGTCTVPTGFSPGTPTLANDNIAGTGRTVSDPNSSGIRFRVVVTSPSTQSNQNMYLTFTGVTNSTTTNTPFYVRVTTYSDTGSTIIDGPTTAASAVLDTTSLAVTASVDPNFTFAVAGVNSGGTVNSATTNITTTTVAIPFGTLSVGSPKIGATDVTITTNAANGYNVTASHAATIAGNPPLYIAATTHKIDSFTGTNTSPTSWSAPNGGTADTNTGFFGYTTESTSLCTGTAGRFSGNKWAGSTTTGAEVICSNTGANAVTTRLGWQLEVNGLQPAGSYQGTVILVATPTY